MSSASEINNLLNDKLYQVIGSTPASIAESLLKIDLKGKKAHGAQIVAISIFSAAVNKATLETFLADARFASVRPLLNSALSIQGRSNMTAMTLLGHCFLTTDFASNLLFATEFRRKMGQDHLWAGELEAGSLSDMQRKILKEKKRVTNMDDARALGTGFLKFTGIISDAMSSEESAMFKIATTEAASPTRSSSSSVPASGTPLTRRDTSGFSPTSAVGSEAFALSNTRTVNIPEDVMTYRRSILQQTDEDIAESINRNGESVFIENTRGLIKKDPTGRRIKAASVAGIQ